jgi:hypothetical protein
LTVGLGFLLVALAPFAIYGAEWAMVWTYLTMPFSILLEMIASFGFPLFTIVTSLICAMFWATLVYLISAIIIRLRRPAQNP